MLITGSNGFFNGLQIESRFIFKGSHIPSQYAKQKERVDQFNSRLGKNFHDKAHASRNWSIE